MSQKRARPSGPGSTAAAAAPPVPKKRRKGAQRAPGKVGPALRVGRPAAAVPVPPEVRNYVWTEADHRLLSAEDVMPQQPIGNAFVIIAACILEEHLLKARLFKWPETEAKWHGQLAAETERKRLPVVVQADADCPENDFIQRHTPRGARAGATPAHPGQQQQQRRRRKHRLGAWSPFVYRTPT